MDMKNIGIPANYKRGAEYVGGHLYFDDEGLIFKPHKFNFQTSEVRINFCDIRGAEPKRPACLYEGQQAASICILQLQGGCGTYPIQNIIMMQYPDETLTPGFSFSVPVFFRIAGRPHAAGACTPGEEDRPGAHGADRGVCAMCKSPAFPSGLSLLYSRHFYHLDDITAYCERFVRSPENHIA